MIVKVTQEHIDKGARCQASCCPITLAITEKLQGRKCFVYHHTLYLDKAYNPGTGYVTSNSVRNFIKRFDYAQPVKPFNFRLTLRKESKPNDS